MKRFIFLSTVFVWSSFAYGNWTQFQATADNHGHNPGAFLDLGNIDTVLKFEMGSPILAAPIVMGDTLFVAVANGLTQAINWKTGEVIWTFNAPGGVVSTPAADEGYLYLGARDGNLYCLNRFTGVEAWRFSVEDTVPAEREIQAPIKLTNDKIYVGAFNGKLYCLNKDGSKNWDFQTNYYIKEAPAIEGDLIVISSRDEAIYCIKDLGSSTQLLWKNRVKEFGEYVPGSVGRCSPVISGGLIFTNSAEAELGHFTRALSLTTGDQTGSISDNSNFNTTGFSVDGAGNVYSNIAGFSVDPLSRIFRKSGSYSKFKRSNAAPAVLGNCKVFHSSYYPKGIYFTGLSQNTFVDSLAMDGYSISSSFAASDSVLFFGTYEGFLFGMGSGQPLIVGTSDVKKVVLDPVTISPNPFNPTTSIRFSLAKKARVDIRVMRISGSVVYTKTLFLHRGRHAIPWTGKNMRGNRLGSGVYLIQVSIDNQTRIHRATLLK